MRQSPRQTTDFILKAEKQKGMAYRELLANLYQHLLEKCLTAGAADMNRPNYLLSSEFKHPGGNSVSISSLPVCLHNLKLQHFYKHMFSYKYYLFYQQTNLLKNIYIKRK